MDTVFGFILILVVLLVIALVAAEKFSRLMPKKILLYLVAILVGLILGSLLSTPVSKLPGLYGEFLPTIVSVILAIASVFLFGKMLPQMDKGLDLLRHYFRLQPIHLIPKHEESAREVVLDTSVLIDRRIVEIARTGFLAQKIILPKFILAELQNIADSKDGDRRDKGRRGLSALEELKKIKKGELEVVTDDFFEIEKVDSKLVALSKKRGASLVTTDFNLNKVAGLQGVRVLNINDLTQNLRPDLLPGDEFEVKVVHIGKDKTQGVGYLEDGTMIVVENGGRLLDKTTKIKISRSLQTTAGKMYFAKVVND